MLWERPAHMAESHGTQDTLFYMAFFSAPQMCTQMWSSPEITSLQALPGNCSEFLGEK